MNDGFADIELAEAIEAIRRQLAAAADRAAGERFQFEVGPVELELAVELRRDVTVKGGVKAWVVRADAEAGAGRTRTHKITVSLTPKDLVTGGSVLVGNPDLGSREGFH
ncbi:trypco2 family protein [Kitasatospora sp. NBC_01266]|uniref:trypco2 family protein n=1 Tax=Kitasatospora sp. NBC_01266 TaxID=2903572 RepID=UPI002E332B85|nr:trypco2 family protein [Kitasatospora sp. NBC_01266]